MLKISCFTVIILLMASCAPDSALAPGPKFMRHLPNGNDSYSQGFRDGCNTYAGIIGSGVLQFNSYSMDNQKMLEDSMYNRGVGDGRNYCTYYLDAAIN